MTKAAMETSNSAILAERLAALKSAADAFASAHAIARNVAELRTAATAYQDAFQSALSVHPDREIILAYAQAATAHAQHNKDCVAATVGGLNSSVVGHTRSLFAAWRSCERSFVDAGYRAIDYQALYDSTHWPGASKKLQFLIYAAFFSRREEGEEATLHCEQMLSRHPVLANPEDLRKGDEVVSWDGSRLVLGIYERPVAGEHEVRSGESTFLTICLLRHKDAVETGVWPFTKGLRIAAYVNGAWVEATWSGYDGDRHIVRLTRGGNMKTSERAHPYQDAVTMGLFQAMAA